MPIKRSIEGTTWTKNPKKETDGTISFDISGSKMVNGSTTTVLGGQLELILNGAQSRTKADSQGVIHLSLPANTKWPLNGFVDTPDKGHVPIVLSPDGK